MNWIVCTAIFSFVIVWNNCFPQKLEIHKVEETQTAATVVRLFSSENKLAFNSNNKIEVYDLTDSLIIRTIKVDNHISAFCISPNDSLLFIGTNDGNLLVFTLSNYIKVSEYNISSTAITCISATNSLVAVGTTKGVLKVLDLVSNKILHDFSMNDKYLTALRFTFDENFLISGGQSKLVTVWDMKSGKVFKVYKKHSNWVSGIALNPDSIHFATCGYDKKIYEWVIKDSTKNQPTQEIKSYHTNWITDLAYQSEGNFLVSVGQDNRIVIHPVTDNAKKNFQLWKKQKLYYKARLFPNTNQRYLSTVSITPNEFNIYIGTNNVGLLNINYYQKFFKNPSSLLRMTAKN